MATDRFAACAGDWAGLDREDEVTSGLTLQTDGQGAPASPTAGARNTPHHGAGLPAWQWSPISKTLLMLLRMLHLVSCCVMPGCINKMLIKKACEVGIILFQ